MPPNNPRSKFPGVTNSEGGAADYSRAMVTLATSEGFLGGYTGTSRSVSASGDRRLKAPLMERAITIIRGQRPLRRGSGGGRDASAKAPANAR